jgi:ATP adenylyltransferase
LIDVNRIWTPWRMAFIRGEKAVNCIFCLKASETQDRENFVVARAKFNLILLNIYPYTTGHLMIAPYVHQANLVQLESEVTAEMMDLARRATRVLRQAYQTESFNIGMNIGAAAGAGIADHVHLHVVPRWQGDSNFMPVLGDARLIPETLDVTYDRLLQAGIDRD